MRRMRVTVVTTAVVGGLLAGVTPASAGPAAMPGAPRLNTTNIPARYAEQSLAWHRCTGDEVSDPSPGGVEGLECATFNTPRDWERPDDRRHLTIAVSRLKSTGATTASVVTNPGGPGAAGRSFPAYLRNQTRLREHQEIIGFDSRGTGKSTNVSCDGATDIFGHLDARNRDPRNLNRILNTVKHTVNSCQRASGDLSRLVNTFQTIKDVDLLRVLLGREKINWIGYSAGTWMGAHYAQKFPERTGRFVLDSATEFTTSWQKSFDWQPVGFERRWREDFLPWIARYHRTYHFGTSGEAARKIYENVRYALTRNPVDVDGERIGPAELDSSLSGQLKKKKNFPRMADFLVQVKTLTEDGASERAKADARAAVKAAISEPTGRHPLHEPFGPADAEAEDGAGATLIDTLCNDGPWTGNRRSVIRRSQKFIDRDLPLAVGGWMSFQMCIFWKGQPRPLPKLDGKGVPPVLIVQSENDPATPIEGATRAHAAFQNSRMLTVSGEGDHGIYGFGNAAVDRVVDDYLVDGIVPEDQSVPGMPLPVPGQ